MQQSPLLSDNDDHDDHDHDDNHDHDDDDDHDHDDEEGAGWVSNCDTPESLSDQSQGQLL